MIAVFVIPGFGELYSILLFVRRIIDCLNGQLIQGRCGAVGSAKIFPYEECRSKHRAHGNENVIHPLFRASSTNAFSSYRPSFHATRLDRVRAS